MLVGVEVLPGTQDESIAALRALGDAVEVVKVRRHDDLRALLDAGLSYRWVVRGDTEGRNPDELTADVLDWVRVLDDTGQTGQCLRLIVANEPNHPESPYRGQYGAVAYLVDVLRPALARIGDVPIPLGAPPLVPYYGTAQWSAALDTLPILLPHGHCYQNEGDTVGAVAECLAMAGSKPIQQLVADEVGDTNAGAEPSYRADRIAEQFYGLAQAGVEAAILFPLAGYADASISYDVDTIAMILSAGRSVRPKRPKRPVSVPATVPQEVSGMTLAELQKLAATIAVAPLPKAIRLTGPKDINRDIGTYQAWERDKSLGTLMSKEIAIDPADGGGVGVLTATGRIIRALPDGTIEIV